MNRTLYLHIGYPKTGTTALQTAIFPSLRENNFYYAGNDEPEGRDIARAFGAHVHNPGSQFIAPSTEMQDILISCEGIIFDCLRYIDTSGRFSPHDPSGLAARCRRACTEFFPDRIRIIITLRKQGELSHSLFAQSYTHFFSRDAKLKQFSHYATSIIARDEIAAAYDYHAITQDFTKEFGHNNVLVLFHEDMTAQPARFLEDLSRFLGQPLPSSIPAKNVRLGSKGRHTQTSTLYDELALIAQKLLPSVRTGLGRHLTFLRSIPGRDSKIIASNQAIENRVTQAYSASNRALGILLDRDLSDIGYW